MRLVLTMIVTPVLGWWFFAVNAAGQISIRAGPRGAKGVFVADRLTDPDQFHGALAFIGLLFLLSLAGFLSMAWNIVVGSERGSDQPQ
jgi:hypothetical protein